MKLLMPLLLILSMLSNSRGAIFISQDDGCWNNKSVWQNGNIPGYNLTDTVIINNHVSFLQDIALLNNSLLQINTPGSICGHFDIHVLDNSELIIYGSFYADTILVPSGHIEINNNGLPSYFYIMTITFGGSIHIQGAFISTAPPFTCNCGDVGLEEPSSNYSDKIFVFPVPSAGDIFVRAEVNINRIEIFNSAGQIEKTYSIHIDRIRLPDNPGIYFLRIYLSNEVQVTKEVLKL